MAQGKKKRRDDWFFTLVMAAGLILCFVSVGYPLFANYVYDHTQSGIISEYEDYVGSMDASEVNREMEACMVYNRTLKENQERLVSANSVLSSVQTDEAAYDARLSGTDGLMGYLEIPCINLHLPVYHGISDTVLEKGLGHIPETSLPVGGRGTHAVITGHTGVSGRRLFDNLPDLEVGDYFIMHVLGEEHWYVVDRIETVLPYETSSLLAEDGSDYVTLVTCTPFGINSHRLLVRGIRTECPEGGTSEASATDTARKPMSTWMKNYLSAIVFALGISLACIIVLTAAGAVRRRNMKTALKEIR